jgi:serine O-acetyltransferase
MFEYLLRRVAVLEHAMIRDNKEILDQDIELESIYDSFIRAMKN